MKKRNEEKVGRKCKGRGKEDREGIWDDGMRNARRNGT